MLGGRAELFAGGGGAEVRPRNNNLGHNLPSFSLEPASVSEGVADTIRILLKFSLAAEQRGAIARVRRAPPLSGTAQGHPWITPALWRESRVGYPSPRRTLAKGPWLTLISWDRVELSEKVPDQMKVLVLFPRVCLMCV